MVFAYFILSHKNPKQLRRLIEAIDNEKSIIVIPSGCKDFYLSFS